MADIVKRNGGTVATEWDPVRAMRDWLRWDPFREMAPVEGWPKFDRATFTPTFDVTETKDAYVFKADVPGVKDSDLEISITGNRLMIAGKRDYEHENKTETAYAYERQFGTFSRVFTLPDGADYEHAKSSLDAGVLTLVVPKTLAAQPRKIEISKGPGKS
jgi:HSP20 family protein